MGQNMADLPFYLLVLQQKDCMGTQLHNSKTPDKFGSMGENF